MTFSKDFWRKRLGAIVLFQLLLPFILGACGDNSTPNSVNANPTIAPSSVPNTSLSSSSPAPIPNKLLLGSQDFSWGEISRYQPGSNDQLKVVALKPELTSALSSWFDNAPKLEPLSSGGNPSVYLLSIKPELRKGLADGSLKFMNSLDGGVRGALVDSKTNIIRGQVSLQPIGGAVGASAIGIVGGTVFQLLTAVSAQSYLIEINQQLVSINRNLEEIKQFLQDKEYTALTGNLDYLTRIRDLFTQQNINETDLQPFRNELEKIERESLQAMSLAKTQMDKNFTAYKDTKIDKGLFGTTRDEKKIDEFEKLTGTYEVAAKNFYLALTVRGLAAQITCAMPGSQSAGLSRLEDANKTLAEWNENKGKFYELVKARIPEMDGFLVNSKKQDNFQKFATTGKTTTSQTFAQANTAFSSNIQLVKSQIQESSQPLLLLGELNTQGKLIKVSQVVKP